MRFGVWVRELTPGWTRWREQKGTFVDHWSQFVVFVKPGGLEFEFESVYPIFLKLKNILVISTK